MTQAYLCDICGVAVDKIELLNKVIIEERSVTGKPSKTEWDACADCTNEKVNILFKLPTVRTVEKKREQIST
jgi:hypothetical protein